MSDDRTTYLKATRHPLPCLLFVLPLLMAYEGCVWTLGGDRPETVRNGADNWLHLGLEAVGIRQPWIPAAALTLGLLVWSQLRRGDQPNDMTGVLAGMGFESVCYALGLWAVSRALPPLLQSHGIALAQSDAAASQRLVSYIGAGIYEEALFRLGLYAVAVKLLRLIGLPSLIAWVVAALGSAVLFSVAHHLGPYGQPYGNYVFLFRVAAGLYFAILYQFRGFGVAVGAHACYNVVVSVGAS